MAEEEQKESAIRESSLKVDHKVSFKDSDGRTIHSCDSRGYNIFWFDMKDDQKLVTYFHVT